MYFLLYTIGAYRITKFETPKGVLLKIFLIKSSYNFSASRTCVRLAPNKQARMPPVLQKLRQVCMYVCLFVCMYVCIYLRMYQCLHGVYVYVSMSACMYVCMSHVYLPSPTDDIKVLPHIPILSQILHNNGKHSDSQDSPGPPPIQT